MATPQETFMTQINTANIFTVRDMILLLLEEPQDALFLITTEYNDLLQPVETSMSLEDFRETVDLEDTLSDELYPQGAVIFQLGSIDLLDMG